MKAQKFTKETILTLGTRDRKFPQFRPGDGVRVAQRIVEEGKEAAKGGAKGKESSRERIQHFEGDVIAMRNHGIASTFTVRKIGENSVPVERVFAWYSPNVVDVKLVRRGQVRRAKLIYMRKRVGIQAYTDKVMRRESEAAAE